MWALLEIQDITRNRRYGDFKLNRAIELAVTGMSLKRGNVLKNIRQDLFHRSQCLIFRNPAQ